MKTPGMLAFILCAIVLSAGCFILDERQGATPVPTTAQITMAVSTTPVPGSTVTSREPAALALQLTDLPGGYIIRERADIPYTDATPFARENGWERGYKVSFYRMDAEKYDITSISQQINIYRIDNIHLIDKKMDVIFDETENDIVALGNDTITVTELPFPKTGDQSSAYRIDDANNTYGVMQYVAIFTRENVIETIEMRGTTTDYEVLKSLTALAAAKIQ